jgi:hypothetical protein
MERTCAFENQQSYGDVIALFSGNNENLPTIVGINHNRGVKTLHDCVGNIYWNIIHWLIINGIYQPKLIWYLDVCLKIVCLAFKFCFRQMNRFIQLLSCANPDWYPKTWVRSIDLLVCHAIYWITPTSRFMTYV